MASNDRQHDAVRVLSAVRFVLGLAVMAAPGVLSRLSGVEPTAGAKFLARLFGSREIALAVVTLDTLDSDAPSPTVVEVNMLVDGLDGLAALVAGRRLPPLARAVTVFGAAGAVATAASLRSRLP